MAQLLPQALGKKGWLLVMSCSDLDENLFGHIAKYDTSAADINPVGSILKSHSSEMMMWISETFDYPLLVEAVNAVPTAELQPSGTGYIP